MTTLTGSESQILKDEIYRLSDNCESKRATFNYHNTCDEKARYFANYLDISKGCQALLVSAIDTFENFEAFMDWVKAEHLEEPVLDVIAFAMTRESPHLTTLGWWMSPGLMLMEEKKSPDSPLSKIKGLYNQLSNSYSSNEGAKYREPAFFINGNFREGFLHGQAFSRKVNHAIVNIIDDCVDKPVETRAWIQKIHDTYQDCAVTGQVIKDVLKNRLMDEPVKGLEGLRDYILGGVMPTGEECSERCRHLVDRLLSTSRVLDLEVEATVLMLNERYRNQAFVAEFVGHAQLAMREAVEEYGRSDEPPQNTPNLKNFTKLYSLMSLDVEELCKIAMMTAGRFSLGKLGDHEDKSPADRMKLAMAIMKQMNPEGLDLRWPEQAILGSVFQALPSSISAEVAQDDDYNRVVAYALTGNSVHLSNMKDGKRLDSIMGADLGL